MRARLLGLAAAVLVVAGGTTALVLAVEDGGPRGDVASAVAEQLRYIDRGSSVVVALDMRYGGDNWEHARALGARALREYRAMVPVQQRLRLPPNLSGALDQLARSAGLSFEEDVRPLLDGYLVVGVSVPPRRSLPRDVQRVQRLVMGAYYDPRRRAYLRSVGPPPAPVVRPPSRQGAAPPPPPVTAPPRPRLRVVRHPDGRPVTQAEGRRAIEAAQRQRLASEPRIVATYRTHGGKLRSVIEKAQEGDPLEPLPGRDGVWLLDRDTALVGDDTLVFAAGDSEQEPGTRSTDSASAGLRQALERRDAGRGFPAARLAGAQRSTGTEDPLALAAGDLTLGRLLVEETNLRRARSELPYLRAIRSVAAAVGIDGGGLGAVARVETDPRQLSDADLPVGPAGSIELPERKDAVVGASRDQSVTTAFAARLARRLFAGSQFVRAVEETERRLGISFEEEFLRQFSCPSASVLEPRGQRFAARSCVRDPARMRALLPRLAPHLPKLVRGLQSLGDEGLATLLLIAPDAPLTPSALGALASVVIRPLRGGDRPRADERLYELSGLRDPQRRLSPAGPEHVVFGMIGDDFVVASDRAGARAAARLKTRRHDPPAASATRVLAKLLSFPPLGGGEDGPATRLFGDLLVSVAADRSALTGRARLPLAR